MNLLTRQLVRQNKQILIKMSSCSSTSTTDLYERQIIYSDSCSQTMLDDDHDDDDYANYNEIYLDKSSIPSVLQTNIKKCDQTTFCRINSYSIGCWTKPGSLLTN